MSAARGKADVAGAVIAGGKASRLGGRAKAFIEVQGQPILDRMLDVLSQRLAAVVISANDLTPYYHTGLPVIPDQVLGQGPLAGLAAVLRWCRRPYVLAVACDMPFLRPEVIELLLSRRTPDADVIAPFIDGRPQPLCALYARRVLPVIERRLERGQRKAADLVLDDGLELRRVYEHELRAADPDLDSFTNVNTPEDLARVGK